MELRRLFQPGGLGCGEENHAAGLPGRLVILSAGAPLPIGRRRLSDVPESADPGGSTSPGTHHQSGSAIGVDGELGARNPDGCEQSRAEDGGGADGGVIFRELNRRLDLFANDGIPNCAPFEQLGQSDQDTVLHILRMNACAFDKSNGLQLFGTTVCELTISRLR